MTYPFKLVPVTERGIIPLALTGAGFFALSKEAVDYEIHLSRSSTRDMFNSMKQILKLWPEDLINRNPLPHMDRISAELEKDSAGPSIIGKLVAGSLSTLASNLARVSVGGRDNVHEELQERANKANAALGAQKDGAGRTINFTSELLNTRRGHPALDWGTRPEIGHFKVVYRMVTDALGLEYDMCRSRGLRLMTSPDPPCIGLANRDVYAQNAKLRAMEDGGYDRIKTVCVTQGEGNCASTLYEVERVEGGSGPPLYRVFGVWVPLVPVMDQVRDCIFAVAEAGAADGYII
ncbi:MAG: hypothetical protein M1839_004656 [Geoglossum umbratile]|nr:MAG: hypothetical protein M1839_004656 [Geoglossum umbratile]